MRKPSRTLAFLVGLGALGAASLAATGTATATTNCVISGVTNSSGIVTFEVHYSDNTTGCSWTVPAGVTSIKSAVVGAGGAGGSVQQPGGGGGGAVLYNPNFAATPGTAIPITIGQGVANVYNVQTRGASGGATSFSDVTAQGGGGGGSGNQYQSGNWLGGSSGSTGGANRHGRSVTTVSHPTYNGWTLYANVGGVGSGVINMNFPTAWNGDSNAFGSGGGGGGAGGPGTDGTTVVNGSNVTVTGGNGGPGIFLLGKCLGAGAPSISSHTTSTTVTRSSTTYMTYLGTSTVTGTWGSTTDCVDPQGNTVTGSATAGGMNASALANTGSAIGADTISSDTNMVWKSSDGNVLISYVVPTPTITSSSTTNVQKPTISGTGIDGNTISVAVAGANYTATVAAGVWAVNLNTATPTSGTLVLNVNGTNTVTASATNADGGVSSSVTQTLTIDTTAPATPTLPSVPTLTNLNNRQINFTSEAGSSPQCSFDSGTYAACTSPYSTGTLADGSHTIRVKTVDAAGNVSAIGTYTWTLDTTPPNQPNIATTAAYQTTKSPTITFSADAGTTLQCKLDTNVATTCTSSTTMVYSNLTEGAHTFTVFSADAAGNASSRSYAFTVDTVIPTVPVISTSGAYQTVSSLSIAFTSDVTAGTQCSIDSGAFAACTSPYSTGTLAEGSHSFQVRGLDSAGNTSSAATYSWTQDTIAPNAPTISNSATYVTTTSASITFTASAGTTTCSIDNATFTSCTSPLATGTLAEGSHNVRIKTTDAAGNVSTISTYSWTQDSIAPSTPVIGNSGAYATTNGINVSFTSEAGSSTQCSLDSGTFVTCSNPYATGTLTEGAHAVRVKSTDAAGNISAISTYSWTQDTIAPAAPAISNSALYVRQNYLTISYTRSAGTTTCQLDSNPAVTCSSSTSHNLASLSEGSHTLRIVTADAAGNSSSATYTFTVDTIAPSVATFTSNTSITNVSTLSLSFTTDAGVSVTCSLDGGTYSSCSSPYQTGALADGSHSLSVRSTDAAGNVSATATHNWTIDTVVPTTPNIGNHDNFVTSSSVTINFTTELGTALTCQLDDGVSTNCSNASSFSLNQLTEGQHTFTITSTDLASNSSTANYVFSVDTIAPTTPVITNSAQYVTTSNNVIIFTTDTGTTTCSVDNAAFTTCSSPLPLNQLAEGSHSVRIKTIDVAGNISTIASYNWTQDTVAPLAAQISNTALYVANSSVTISFTSSEGSLACQLDSGSETACTSATSMTYQALSEGAHSVTVFNTDLAGNRNSTTYNFTIDTIAPASPTKATENAGPLDRTSSNSATFNFTTPAGTTTQCRFETTQPSAYDWTSCNSGTSLSSLPLGVYRFSVRSVDAAGNLSSPTVYDWEVTPPGPAAPGIAIVGNIVTLSGAATGANGDRYEAKIVDANDSIISPWGTVSATFALRQSNGNYRVFARLVDDHGTIGSVASLAVTVTDQPAPAAGTSPRLTIASNSGYSNQSNLGITIDWPVGTKSVKLVSTQNSNGGNGTTSDLTTEWTNSNGHRELTWNFTPAGVPTVTATHQITAEFLDAAGAVINTQSSTVIIDVQAPTLTSAIPTAIDGTNLPIQVTASDESGGSGLAGVIITRTVNPVAAAAAFGPAAVVDQEYTVVNGYVTIPNVSLGESMTVKVKDRAGNISVSSFTVAALNRQTLNPIAKSSGTAKVGQTLTVKPGTWPKTHTVTYQWLADGVVIAGATKSTFKLTNAQAGKRITAAVTGTRATFYPITVTTAATAFVTGGTLTGPTPTITGTQKVGQVLTATPGNWAAGITLSYTWKRGAAVVGTGLTYTLVPADKGKKITFNVSATKLGFNALEKTATTGAIKP